MLTHASPPPYTHTTRMHTHTGLDLAVLAAVLHTETHVSCESFFFFLNLLLDISVFFTAA